MDVRIAGFAGSSNLEAQRTYRNLTSKARRVVTDAFTSSWSPDGTKLAFSTGFHGYNGVAVLDAETGQTDLLISPGKDPRWSPDGQYLLFVRDCQALPIAELAGAERMNRDRENKVEEVWVMRADGTEPRRLTSGCWPCWGLDPDQIYFYSDHDSVLYTMSIDGKKSARQPILAYTDRIAELSPDRKHVACEQGASLQVLDVVSGSLFREWAYVSRIQGKVWSSDGREICFGTEPFADNTAGLWIQDLDEQQGRQVLEGPIFPSSLSADGTELVLNLEAPYFEVWVVDLDPNVSLAEALGPGRTLSEYLRDVQRREAIRRSAGTATEVVPATTGGLDLYLDDIGAGMVESNQILGGLLDYYCEDDPAFAGSHVLGRVERKATSAETTHRLPLESCAVGLAGVLDDDEFVATGDFHDGGHVAWLAIEMHRQDRTGTLGDPGLDGAGLYQAGIGFDIHKDRPRANEEGAVRGGDETERCGDHLVAGADLVRQQRQPQRRRARRDGYRMLDAAQFGEASLELGYA